MVRQPEGVSRDRSSNTTKKASIGQGNVAMVVLNWNSWSNTVECLESLQRLTYPDYRMLVVDNGSTDDSVKNIKSWAGGHVPVESDFFEFDARTKPVRVVEYDRATAEAGEVTEDERCINGLAPSQHLVLIHCGDNLGIAGGYNVGIRYALARGFDYIWVMNNDVVLDPVCLELCVETLVSDPQIGVVAPKVLYYSNPSHVAVAGGLLRLWQGKMLLFGVGAPDGDAFSGTRDTAFVAGCALLGRRMVYEQLGLWAEEYFVIHEDSDWSARVGRSSDFAMAVNLDARVWHKEGGVSDTGDISPVSAYFANRNRFILVFRHGSWVEKLAFSAFYLLSRLPKFLLLLARGRRNLVAAELNAVVDFVLSRYGPADERKMRLWRSS